MDTVNSLATELGAQPHEVAAFGDLGQIGYDTPLDEADVKAIRESWGPAPVELPEHVRNHQADRVLDDLAQIVDRAGYGEQ